MALQRPKSTKTENVDKIQKETLLVDSYRALVSPLGQSIVVSVSTLYLFLMHQGTIPAELKSWQLLTMISSVLATALRHWALKTLDRFFTFKLAIREGHRLVKTGPYRCLLHPSYTGLITIFLTYVAVMGYGGLWTYLIQPRLPIPVPGALVALAVLWYQMAAFFNRAKEEEAMLAQTFGQEWADHAATRWRLVPLIY
ncbi:hypothetical protein BG006_009402 [Podila minutissima]|uniref:Protein-S-isoprenylcysteine O-methyltransferase n=1 Tax=Podila minutissima TaxID=64525 RepID=A0A9P5VIX8_9FUNG|nr:hypothetical protein BG006_009402 [Podila minutissima]